VVVKRMVRARKVIWTSVLTNLGSWGSAWGKDGTCCFAQHHSFDWGHDDDRSCSVWHLNSSVKFIYHLSIKLDGRGMQLVRRSTNHEIFLPAWLNQHLSIFCENTRHV
jgi:hypothetical protein